MSAAKLFSTQELNDAKQRSRDAWNNRPKALSKEALDRAKANLPTPTRFRQAKRSPATTYSPHRIKRRQHRSIIATVTAPRSHIRGEGARWNIASHPVKTYSSLAMVADNLTVKERVHERFRPNGCRKPVRISGRAVAVHDAPRRGKSVQDDVFREYESQQSSNDDEGLDDIDIEILNLGRQGDDELNAPSRKKQQYAKGKKPSNSSRPKNPPRRLPVNELVTISERSSSSDATGNGNPSVISEDPVSQISDDSNFEQVPKRRQHQRRVQTQIKIQFPHERSFVINIEDFQMPKAVRSENKPYYCQSSISDGFQGLERTPIGIPMRVKRTSRHPDHVSTRMIGFHAKQLTVVSDRDAREEDSCHNGGPELATSRNGEDLEELPVETGNIELPAQETGFPQSEAEASSPLKQKVERISQALKRLVKVTGPEKDDKPTRSSLNSIDKAGKYKRRKEKDLVISQQLSLVSMKRRVIIDSDSDSDSNEPNSDNSQNTSVSTDLHASQLDDGDSFNSESSNSEDDEDAQEQPQPFGKGTQAILHEWKPRKPEAATKLSDHIQDNPAHLQPVSRTPGARYPVFRSPSRRGNVPVSNLARLAYNNREIPETQMADNHYEESEAPDSQASYLPSSSYFERTSQDLQEPFRKPSMQRPKSIPGLSSPTIPMLLGLRVTKRTVSIRRSGIGSRSLLEDHARKSLQEITH